MSNSFSTATIIAKEALMLLKNSMQMGNRVHRDYKKEMYDPKTAGTVTIDKPVRFSVTDGATLANQDITQYTTSIAAPNQKHVSFRISSADQTLSVEGISKKYIQPAVARLANKVDEDLMGLYTDVWNTVGTPGTAPNSFSVLANAAKRLDKLGVPQEDRHMVLNPDARWDLADALKGLYSTNLTEDAVRRGDVGDIGMFDIGMSQNVKVHTTGTYSTGSTPLTNGVSSDGAVSIVTDGWAASTLVLKAGDVFTLAGVNDVNPMSGADLGYLKQFVAKSDVTSDGSGNATITVYSDTPGIQDSGAYKSVTAHIADGVAVNPWAATGGLSGAGAEASNYTMNLAFHKNAFALVYHNIMTPDSAQGFTATDEDSGIAVRCIKDYDVTNDREVWRLDVLYSVGTIYPDLACRVVG